MDCHCLIWGNIYIYIDILYIYIYKKYYLIERDFKTVLSMIAVLLQPPFWRSRMPAWSHWKMNKSIYQSIWLRKYVHKMWSNRILVQAVGIPLKHALAFYGLSLCILEMQVCCTGKQMFWKLAKWLCFQTPTPQFKPSMPFPNHFIRSELCSNVEYLG